MQTCSSSFSQALHGAGSFTLKDGQALSLQPPAASVLRIAQGRVWATLSSAPGDHVLVPGSSLHIPAGEHVVIEPWPLQERCPVFFDWDPAPVYLSAPAPRVTLLPVREAGLARDRLAVGQALADLRAALGFAVGAGGRLVVGLARFAIGLVARPRFGALA